ncbi:hypothetical protein Phi39:1_gp09 [Cellulophaga phage phi39:1]|uniref:hypothetical protein n=1 Tax=Cellulophaga phage phi39:1 TaxID=1327993 RepID=UPI000351E3DE|nr:hypothetical protein Phi39:1_gp09 [Cellulophaga phage phi39:1]AGO49124.1 hypothetical protein Phi39:1_gp09 [Cellulophaga phage phi39:1]
MNVIYLLLVNIDLVAIIALEVVWHIIEKNNMKNIINFLVVVVVTFGSCFLVSLLLDIQVVNAHWSRELLVLLLMLLILILGGAAGVLIGRSIKNDKNT